MVLVNAVGSEARFAAYVESLASVIGHKDGSVRCVIIARG